jgi:hypothetical protein
LASTFTHKRDGSIQDTPELTEVVVWKIEMVGVISAGFQTGFLWATNLSSSSLRNWMMQFMSI